MFWSEHKKFSTDSQWKQPLQPVLAPHCVTVSWSGSDQQTTGCVPHRPSRWQVKLSTGVVKTSDNNHMASMFSWQLNAFRGHWGVDHSVHAWLDFHLVGLLFLMVNLMFVKFMLTCKLLEKNITENTWTNTRPWCEQSTFCVFLHDKIDTGYAIKQSFEHFLAFMQNISEIWVLVETRYGLEKCEMAQQRNNISSMDCNFMTFKRNFSTPMIFHAARRNFSFDIW